jgi:hypothetical protein
MNISNLSTFVLVFLLDSFAHQNLELYSFFVAAPHRSLCHHSRRRRRCQVIECSWLV